MSIATAPRNLSHLSDQQILEAYKTSTNHTNPSNFDLTMALLKRHPDAIQFEVIINNNSGQNIPRIRLLGTADLLRAQGVIHPIVMDLIDAYVANQAKQDLYFFLPELHLGFEMYTVSC